MSSVLENIKAMRQKAKQAETKYYTAKGGKSLRLKDLKEGKTILRIAPSYNEKFPSPFVPFRSVYLQVELNVHQLSGYNISDIIKDKKLEKQFGIESIANLSDWSDEKLKEKVVEVFGEGFTYKVTKRIFCANLHGKLNANNQYPKDLIDAYIKFVAADMYSSIGDKDEAKKRLGHIFGWKDKDGWHSGITPSTSFVSYLWDWDDKSSLRKFEFYDKYMDRVEELYVKFDGEGDPLTIDPFSDAKGGVGLQFDRYINKKGSMDFRIEDVSFTSSDAKKFGTYTNFIKQFELSEEQLKQLKEVKSLQELYGRGTFKASDFQLQLNGLILFDAKHEYNAFENDDFLKLVEEISEQFSEEEEQEQANDDAKTGADIDKAFAKKQLGLKKPIEVAEEVVNEEAAELAEAMALIKKNKAAQAAKKKKVVVKKDEVEENSFREEVPETNTKLNDKLAMLRKNIKKKE